MHYKTCLLATLMLGAATLANAEPPTVGHWRADHFITVCDDEQQINALVSAGKEKGDGFKTAYGILYSAVNQWNEHTCMVMPPGGEAEVIKLGEPQVMWFGDTQANVITAQVKAHGDRTLWLLYNTGNITGAEPSSLPPKGREGMRSYIVLPPKIPWSIWNLFI